MPDTTLPPVGATVVDGDGVMWTCVNSKWTTDGFTRQRLWRSESGFCVHAERAGNTTAIWRSEQARQEAETRAGELLVQQGTLERDNIALRQRLARFEALAREARKAWDMAPDTREDAEYDILKQLRALAQEAK